MAPTQYSCIIVEQDGPVGVIRLNRPEALNALGQQITQELIHALNGFDTNNDIGAIVITGSDKVFAAGADIKQFQGRTMANMIKEDTLDWSSKIRAVRKPMIAAVNGYALGGGCELAMMCDIIYAGEKALFGQPEINLGIIPGAGGTQRLVKAIGKSKAMEICLTGSVKLNAQEALAAGLVSAVYPVDKVLPQSIKTAKIIASKGQIAAALTKSAINQSFEVPLEAGLLYERRLFQTAFGTEDRKEGVDAFVNKRVAKFSHL
ncbi:putative enoyl-CoA hydratase, mitochondrial [Smittium mucronatum]|uniref:Probable enoyl-CoA hydratase, mitochondrial n=1 Tax=Smittium mucronatum TaxID=133383 RepID=A0A1R0H787_9FUNG|nr:putative enoyl-CoA hydratase, mitochondrial [Smittium mucronatum]